MCYPVVVKAVLHGFCLLPTFPGFLQGKNSGAVKLTIDESEAEEESPLVKIRLMEETIKVLKDKITKQERRMSTLTFRLGVILFILFDLLFFLFLILIGKV